MSIQFNARSRRGEPAACIRIEHILTRTDLTALLIAATQPPYNDEEMYELTKTEVEELIRAQLDCFGRSRANDWQDLIDVDIADEDSVFEWAMRQVEKLGPTSSAARRTRPLAARRRPG